MFASVSLPARLQPMDRGEVFEDPLDAWLQARGFGAVTGGGTAFTPGEEITACDIELDLVDASDDVLDAMVVFLEGLWAPVGSTLTMDGQTRAFGRAQGAALYLNGTDLPAAVYETSDTDALIDAINAALEGKGRFMSSWDGPTETALYIYGESFDGIADALAPIIAATPECEKSRLVQIA